LIFAQFHRISVVGSRNVFAAGVAVALESRCESVGEAGAIGAGVSEAGDALEELGAELLLGFAVSPAAFLH
jgi:hypothetical protein